MDNKKGSKELIVDMEEVIENEKEINNNDIKKEIKSTENKKKTKQNMLQNQALINAFNLDEEESEEENESQSETEIEPKLKYQIITGSLSDILKKDNISTITVSDRFLVRFNINNNNYLKIYFF